ncbi:MAG: hypothetical protein AAGA68_26470 [Pseudomonadota bacterium]
MMDVITYLAEVALLALLIALFNLAGLYCLWRIGLLALNIYIRNLKDKANGPSEDSEVDC